MTSERQISSDIMAKTMNGFNELTIQSTINDSAYYDSEEYDAESDPNSDPKVSTYTNKRNYPHKLLTNREIPAIIQGVIPPVNQRTADGVATSRGYLHAVCTVLHKDIVTGAMRGTTSFLKEPPVINWKNTSGLIPVDNYKCTTSAYPLSQLVMSGLIPVDKNTVVIPSYPLLKF